MNDGLSPKNQQTGRKGGTKITLDQSRLPPISTSDSSLLDNRKFNMLIDFLNFSVGSAEVAFLFFRDPEQALLWRDTLRTQNIDFELLVPNDAKEVQEIVCGLYNYTHKTKESPMWIDLFCQSEEKSRDDQLLLKAVAGLNQGRNLLLRQYHRPLVFVGDKELFNALTTNAPDFESIVRYYADLTKEL